MGPEGGMGGYAAVMRLMPRILDLDIIFLGGGGGVAVYNITKGMLIRDQQEMTFFAHLMLFRTAILSPRAYRRRAPVRGRPGGNDHPCQAIPVVLPPSVALQPGHGSPETTPRGTSRVYRVYSRYYGAGTLRSSEGVPLISGVGAVGWFVPDGVGVWAGWCRRVPGGRLDGDMGVPTPTCSPIPLMG